MWPLILVLDGPCPWQGHQFHWSWCHWSWLGHGLLAHGGLVEAMAFPWRIEPMVCHIWFKWLCHGFCCTISMTGTQWHCNVVPIDGSLAHTTWTSLWLLVWKAVGRPHASKLVHAPLSGAPWAGTWPAGSCMQKKLYVELSPPWHLYVLLLANLLAFYLTYLLAFYLAYLLAFYLAYLLAFYLAYLLQYVLAYLLTFYLANILAYLLAFYLTFYLAFYLAYLLAFYLAVEVQRCPLSLEGPRLRSSGAHWALKVAGWGPALPTGLGRSLVEVQRCPLRSEPGGWGPAVPTQIGSRQLRSSSAHCARKLAKRLAKSWQGGSGRGSWCRHGRGETGGGGRRRMRRTALIKSNSPHLAGGEQHSTKLGMKHWVLVHGNQLHIQNPHESSGCYMDMVEQAKQHGSNAQQNEHESTMCSTAGNTHFCTCSCGHGGLEVTKAWVIAPVGHIPEVVLVALVYVHWPWLWPWQELGCLIVHPQLMEDSKVDPPVPVALLQSWCLWLWPWEWCHHLGHLQLVPATAYGTGNKCQQMAM